MKTKRISVALLVASIATISFPVHITAQSTRTSPVAPRRDAVTAIVQEAYDKFKNENKGKNADYIPYLAQVDSKRDMRRCVVSFRESIGELLHSWFVWHRRVWIGLCPREGRVVILAVDAIQPLSLVVERG